MISACCHNRFDCNGCGLNRPNIKAPNDTVPVTRNRRQFDWGFDDQGFDWDKSDKSEEQELDWDMSDEQEKYTPPRYPEIISLIKTKKSWGKPIFWGYKVTY